MPTSIPPRWGCRSRPSSASPSGSRKQAFLKALRARKEVLECHHVTGADSYMMSVAVVNMSALESFLGDINRWGETRTAIVMSTPIFRRGLRRP